MIDVEIQDPAWAAVLPNAAAAASLAGETALALAEIPGDAAVLLTDDSSAR